MNIVTNIPEHIFNLPIDFEPPLKKSRDGNNIPDVDSLNEQQRIVFDVITAYLSNTLTLDLLKTAIPDTTIEDINEIKMMVLKGYAGTGKTYTITQILKNYVMMMQANIAVTAPTNKAVKVLKNSADFTHSLINFCTIHKLYGLKEQINEITGKVTFAPEFGKENEIDDTSALILDEASMLQDDIFHLIKDSNNRFITKTDKSKATVSSDNIDDFLNKITGVRTQIQDNLKVVFVGDPIQIPPIGKDGCIPFNEGNAETYGLVTLNLTDIVRQAEGNPILEMATIMRNNHTQSYIPYKRETVVNEMGGIMFINKTDKDTLYRLCKIYFTNPRFKHDADFMKVIAWTNKTVNFMNRKIRQMIYGSLYQDIQEKAVKDYIDSNIDYTPDDLKKVAEKAELPRILVGEKLVADKPITEEVSFRTVTLYQTNDEFEVVSFEIKEAKVIGDFYVKVYRTKTMYKNESTGKVEYKTIEVVHEDSAKQFEEVCAQLKATALDKRTPRELKGQKWKLYYMVDRKFASVKYNYAITGHKAQGSTYENTIVIVADIDANRKIKERNSIKYVAVTRAKQNLFIVE